MRTLLKSVPLASLFGLAVSIAAYFWIHGVSGQGAGSYVWVIFGFLALTFISLQTWVNFTVHRYDPTWAMKFQDLLNEPQTRAARAKAAKKYQTDKVWSGDVEAALDIIEDIGFYVEHETIGVEVAHHHFYFWIRGYVQTADRYIKDYQKDDPLAYDHCFSLLDKVTRYEAKLLKERREKQEWDDDEVAEFIQSEIDECSGGD